MSGRKNFIKDVIFLSIIVTAIGGIDIIFNSGLGFATTVSNQFIETNSINIQN